MEVDNGEGFRWIIIFNVINHLLTSVLIWCDHADDCNFVKPASETSSVPGDFLLSIICHLCAIFVVLNHLGRFRRSEIYLTVVLVIYYLLSCLVVAICPLISCLCLFYCIARFANLSHFSCLYDNQCRQIIQLLLSCSSMVL